MKMSCRHMSVSVDSCALSSPFLPLRRISTISLSSWFNNLQLESCSILFVSLLLNLRSSQEARSFRSFKNTNTRKEESNSQSERNKCVTTEERANFILIGFSRIHGSEVQSWLTWRDVALLWALRSSSRAGIESFPYRYRQVVCRWTV